MENLIENNFEYQLKLNNELIKREINELERSYVSAVDKLVKSGSTKFMTFRMFHDYYGEKEDLCNNIKHVKGWKHSTNKKEADEYVNQKQNSPGYTLTTYSEDSVSTSKLDTIKNPYIIIDIDDIEVNIENLKKLQSYYFVIGTGISFGGNGFYSIVKFNKDKIKTSDDFKKLFNELRDYYLDDDIIIDNSCSNINRLRAFSPYEFYYNVDFEKPFDFEIKETEIIYTQNKIQISEVNYTTPTTKIGLHKDTIPGFTGNEARMFVSSALVIYFGEEQAKKYISEKIENAKETIACINEKSIIYNIKPKIKKWCFENLEIFQELEQTNIDIENNLNLYDYINTRDLLELVDETINIEKDKFLSDVLNLGELGNKLIISSPCGTGKTHFIRECKKNNQEHTYIIVPYASIQKQYQKEGIECLNIKILPDLLKNKIIKKNDNIYLDEIHLGMIDSQYRSSEIMALQQLIERNDINIYFFTATPTPGLIKQLKAKFFKFIRITSDKEERKIGLLNIELPKRNNIDAILKGVLNIIEKEEKSYTGIIIASNRYVKRAINLGFEEDHILTADRYRYNKDNSDYELTKFCSGEYEWTGLYWTTRFGYAGIDNQLIGQNLLFITFNSEINIVDLIQLTNRCRKANVDVINIIDNYYEPNKPNFNGLFNFALVESENQFHKRQIINMSNSIFLDDKKMRMENINYLDGVYIKERSDLKINDMTIIDKDGNEIYSSNSSGLGLGAYWNLSLDEERKTIFNNSFDIYEISIQRRLILSDKRYKQSIMRNSDLVNDIRCLKSYFENPQGEIEYLKKLTDDNIIVKDWSCITSKTKTENREKLKDELLTNPNYFLSKDIHKIISDGNKKEIAIILDWVCDIIYDVKTSINHGKQLACELDIHRCDSEKDVLEKILASYEKNECLAYINGDIDTYYNATRVLEIGSKKLISYYHDVNKKGGRSGLSIGKNIGKNINKKYTLIKDNSIMFNNLDDCYSYVKDNEGYSKTIDAFKKRDYKKYFTKEVKK